MPCFRDEKRCRRVSDFDSFEFFPPTVPVPRSSLIFLQPLVLLVRVSSSIGALGKRLLATVSLFQPSTWYKYVPAPVFAGCRTAPTTSRPRK